MTIKCWLLPLFLRHTWLGPTQAKDEGPLCCPHLADCLPDAQWHGLL